MSATEQTRLDQLVAACAEIAKPSGFNPSYGTAGFRAHADLLSSTTFRCGLVIALRVMHVGSSCGMMITASHNVHTDNGLKLVDFNGHMLPQNWEPLATRLGQASSPDELAAALRPLLPPTLAAPKGASVLIGHDTRTSSEPLAALAAQGASLLGLPIIHMGCVTTPQLHFAVVDFNARGTLSHDTYFETLASGFQELWEDAPALQAQAALLVDCANGVGATQLQRLLRHLPAIRPVQLKNTGEGLLNSGVGADFVQKEKRLPQHFEDVAPGSRCCTMDGDADRLVYFTTEADGSFCLLDGDRIAALAASFVQKLLSQLPQELATGITVGVVQTAYANGASTRYIREVLNLPVVVTKTGVKHLHPAAQRFDVGIYFEANGHGTVLLSASLASKLQQVSTPCLAASHLLAMRRMVNQEVGDALSLILTVEVILKTLAWDLTNWLAVYKDLPSCQTKLQVADRSVITTNEDDTQCLTPAGVQQAINETVRQYKLARAFVRPSGTEDIVRVYAEADTHEAAEQLARVVMRIVYDHAGGCGTRP